MGLAAGAGRGWLSAPRGRGQRRGRPGSAGGGLAGRRRCGRRVVGSAAAGASRGRRFLASAPSVRGGCLCLLLTGIGLRGCERCLSFSPGVFGFAVGRWVTAEFRVPESGAPAGGIEPFGSKSFLGPGSALRRADRALLVVLLACRQRLGKVSVKHRVQVVWIFSWIQDTLKRISVLLILNFLGGGGVTSG